MELLVKKAMKGDADAFAELIRLNTQSLYKIAWSYLKNDQDVADAIQDTILACYEKIGTLRNPRFFRTWMIRILINKCKDFYRNRELTDVEINGNTGGQDHNIERCEWKQLLLSLDESSRIILQLYYFEEFAVKEIAEILEMNPNTVMTKLDRARKKLRREME